MFQCTPVFHANNTSAAKIKVNQGGTSSSKTYSIMQLLFLRAIENNGFVITVTGESIPNLKKGAYRDAKSIYNTSKELPLYVQSWNESDRIIYFKNGSLIEFVSNLDEQSAKNGKRHILFVNEANGISWPIFFQMAIRTRHDILLDYNPSAPFWAHEKLIGTNPETNDLSATVQLIISDHRHNCFLSAEEHAKIEGIKDKELWKVYARGMTGNLTGLIYPNATKIPDDQFPWSEPFFGGLDFGYTNDPTAGVKIARIGESIFLHELSYTPGIAPIQMKEIFYANQFTNNIPIYCDHDPDQIAQLRRLHVLALPARKGVGSVNAGILKMKEYKIFYTASSTNLDEEKRKYMWVIDPVTGKPTNTPIDQFNHCWDASRIGVYTHFYRAA
jgi:phage terminase large subunit